MKRLLAIPLIIGLAFGILQMLKPPSPQSLLETKIALFVHYSDLLENRINVVSLTKLDPHKKEFVDEKALLIQKIRETNQQSLKDLDTVSIRTLLKPFVWTGPLTKEHKRILTDQKDFVDQLENTDIALKNIFLYNPLEDLGSLNPLEEQETVVKRIEAAIEGLEKISNKKLCVDYLEPAIAKTQESLQNLKGELILENLNLVIENFDNLREVALKCEIETAYSQKNITLLKDQTNLIIKYKRLLEKIDQTQKQIAEKNLQD